MIDIVREIEAVQREVGSDRIPAGDGRAVRLQTRLRRAHRGRLGRPDEPRADRPLVPADQRRLPPRRSLPVRGQRRRRDRRVRAAESAEGDLGVRRDRPARPTSRSSRSGCRRSTTRRPVLELEHTAVVPEERWDQYGPGAVGVGWDQGLLGLALAPARRPVGDPDGVAAVGRGTRLRARGAARRGARRTGPRAPTRTVVARRRREHDRVLRARSGGECAHSGPRGRRATRPGTGHRRIRADADREAVAQAIEPVGVSVAVVRRERPRTPGRSRPSRC